MSSNPASQVSAVAAPRSTAAQTLDIHASRESASSDKPRKASPELDYGCVDWFIYAADARIAPAPSLG